MSYEGAIKKVLHVIEIFRLYRLSSVKEPLLNRYLRLSKESKRKRV